MPDTKQGTGGLVVKEPGLILVLLECKLLLHGHGAFPPPCPVLLEGSPHSRTCSGSLWLWLPGSHSNSQPEV